MEIRKLIRVLLQVVTLGFLSACAGDSGEKSYVEPDPIVEEQSSQDRLKEAISAHPTETDFTLLLANENSVFFNQGRGQSNADTLYQSASTSNMVTATVILSLVDHGYLSLDDRPQKFIPWWSTGVLDRRSYITLRQLLSFTSGLQSGVDELCTYSPNTSFEDCVMTIHDNAGAAIPTPGSEFVYGQNHMQVAGMMAYKARGFNSWLEVFIEFQQITGLFPNSIYDFPSVENPLLAGGMHWTGSDYIDFLQAHLNRSLLSESSMQEMFSDHTKSGEVELIKSPVEGIGYEWHYGLGTWNECDFKGNPGCVRGRYSSPGAYGAYPFIDFDNGYVGLLSRQGELKTFVEGYEVYADLESLIYEVVSDAN